MQWDEHVPAASHEINYHLIDALGFSPYQIIFGAERCVVLNCYRKEIMEAVDRLAKEENLVAKDGKDAII